MAATGASVGVRLDGGEASAVIQASLFADPARQRFERFHRENPGVYRRLLEMARELRRKGRTRLGIGMLFEVLRYESLIQTTGEPWKLNNTHRAWYARMLLAEPDLQGLFETRASIADN